LVVIRRTPTIIATNRTFSPGVRSPSSTM